LAVVSFLAGAGGAGAAPGPAGAPSWVRDVGSRSAPPGRACAAPLPAESTPATTSALQQAIDACSASGGGTLALAPRTYKVGALFLKSGVHLLLPEGSKLKGSSSDKDYPRLWTRVAGIEMEWPAAVVNVNEQRNVMVSGAGTIEGRGSKDWIRYFLRIIAYAPVGLRWAADYDTRRIRNLVVWRSSDVTVKGLTFKKSGFWNVQVTYSDHVTLDGLKVSDNGGPSTDGVDVDSSSHVLVQGCDITCGDDAIALKAGRDYDGLSVDRPTEYVVVRNNVTRKAFGMLTFGSETSGGIRHVYAEGNRALGTSRGLRFKSARTRGGVIQDLLVRDTVMDRVGSPFVLQAEWRPSYSYPSIPGWVKDPPPHWKTLVEPVLPEERGWPEFRDIVIEGARITGAGDIFDVTGLPERPVRGVVLRDVTAEGRKAGSLKHARDWRMENVKLKVKAGLELTECENVEQPELGN
jgi:hypothetical protein